MSNIMDDSIKAADDFKDKHDIKLGDTDPDD